MSESLAPTDPIVLAADMDLGIDAQLPVDEYEAKLRAVLKVDADVDALRVCDPFWDVPGVLGG